MLFAWQEMQKLFAVTFLWDFFFPASEPIYSSEKQWKSPIQVLIKGKTKKNQILVLLNHPQKKERKEKQNEK